MVKTQLVIGNCRYSSWSLRAWFCLRKSGAPFEEVLLPLDTPEFAERIAEFSPTGRVPVLWDDGQCIWDSLAICEYINERFANGALWPEDLYSRGLGRSMVAEMHAGFPELRNRMPMNFSARNRAVPMDEALTADIERMFTLWADSLACHSDKGPWLLGDVSIADAMFAPVVVRFSNYGVALPADVAAYCDHVLADEDMQAWREKAAEEPWRVEADEAGTERE